MRLVNKDLESTEPLSVSLAGQPNTGKSTLFNRLTGSQQHVGNWLGKTVEQKTGKFSHKGRTFTLIDLPGTYSLSTNSADELIIRNHIVSEKNDVLVVMIDVSQMERSMYLLAEIIGIDIPIVVACSMVDIDGDQDKKINLKKIEKR